MNKNINKVLVYCVFKHFIDFDWIFYGKFASMLVTISWYIINVVYNLYMLLVQNLTTICIELSVVKLDKIFVYPLISRFIKKIIIKKKLYNCIFSKPKLIPFKHDIIHNNIFSFSKNHFKFFFYLSRLYMLFGLSFMHKNMICF